MFKLHKVQIVKNVSSSWLMLATDMVAGLFLSPYILHHLGDSAFGLWVLTLSITGYYGLFDFGIRSSVLRYVSKCVATKDQEGLNSVINTSLFSYICVGAGAFLVTLGISTYIDTLFRISPEFHTTARWLLLIVGSAVALGFPLGIAGSALEGLQRFDLLNATGIGATVVRTALIVVALERGHGLLTVAAITVGLPIIAALIRGWIVLRLCPLSLGWHYVDEKTFRQMAGYSGVTFMIIVAGRLKFKTDEIIIGSMLSAAAITYFSVGARIVDYAGEVVVGLAQVLVPMSSHSEATGNVDGLRRIFVVGNRFCALAIFPTCSILVILGKSIIAVWVGDKYVAQSYPVLVIMILATTLMWAQGASTRVLFGIGRHGTLAVVTLIEGAANVILSTLLVRPYGIVGDAVGTAVPLVCSMVFFLPWHLCRRLGVEMGSYLRQAYLLPAMLCVPLALSMLAMKAWFVPRTYVQLAVHVSVAAVVYGIGLVWAFAANELTKYSDPSEASAKLTIAPVTVPVDNAS